MNKEEFVKTFKNLCKKRLETHEEAYWELDEQRENFASFLVSHIDDTIDYLNNNCTEMEFVILSEFYHTIAEKSQSKEFVDVLEKLAKKYPEVTKKYNLMFFIKWAKNCIN